MTQVILVIDYQIEVSLSGDSHGRILAQQLILSPIRGYAVHLAALACLYGDNHKKAPGNQGPQAPESLHHRNPIE
jgi:hypothetical protein